MIAPRPPGQVMRLASLGASHPTRLSFMRQLTRRMAREGWRVERARWDVDARGVGAAVYVVRAPARRYSLVAFAHDLPDALRSDRVIAEAWDATFALVDGEATEADVARLAGEVPRQEAGRVSARELVLSRANRSARLWGHVVDALAAGRQPDAARLDAVGYLMRTTAVYGSGKFGAADRETYADRPELAAPFQAEMLAVWLIRGFVRDLAEHHARMRNPDAPRLDDALARRLGIGNSTGLGMAPFLVRHPRLIHRWIAAREAALARVRGVEATAATEAVFRERLAGMRRMAEAWRPADAVLARAVEGLRADLALVAGWPLEGALPWDALVRRSEGLGAEAREAVAALVLEPHGDLVDDLGAAMADDAPPARLDGAMTVGALRAALGAGEAVDWPDVDWDDPAETARLWYVSREKAEPRLAERRQTDLEPWEQPMGTARAAARLRAALEDWPDGARVAEVALARPDLRGAMTRAQVASACPYAEVRGNLLGADMRPVDLLRAKLAMFGATRFDPRSDRWLRICLFAGAPLREGIGEDPDGWVHP